MDLSKSMEYFQPEMVENTPIHIIGCGAIGSHVAESLARLGIKQLVLWDFDEVEEHNIANQMFTTKDLHRPKTQGVIDFCQAINPDFSAEEHTEGWNEQPLSGYVFMCVDSIKVRKQIVEHCMTRIGQIKAIFDFRMRLEDAQHYAAIGTFKSMQQLMKTMAFTDEEAKTETPVSACNVSLSVNPTVKAIVAFGIANFINYVKDEKLKKLILLDAFAMTLDTFDHK